MSFARFVGGMAKRVNQLKDEKRAEDSKMRLLQEELDYKNRLAGLNEGFSKNVTFNGSSAIFRTGNDKSKPEAYAMETFANLPQLFDQLGINNSQDALEFFKSNPDLVYAGNVAVGTMSRQRDTSEGGETITTYGVRNFTGTDPRMEDIATELESSYLEQDNSGDNRPSYIKGYRSPDPKANYTIPANLQNRENQIQIGNDLEDYMVGTYKPQGGINNEANISPINEFYFNTKKDVNGKPVYTFDYNNDHAEFFSMLESGIDGSKITRSGNAQRINSSYKSETEALKRGRVENSTAIQNVDSIADEIERLIYGYTDIEGKEFIGIGASSGIAKIGLIINAFSNEQTGVLKQFKNVMQRIGSKFNTISSVNGDVLLRTRANRFITEKDVEEGNGLGKEADKSGNLLEDKAREDGISLELAKEDNNYIFTNQVYGTVELGDSIHIEDALNFIKNGGIDQEDGSTFKNADGSESIISQGYKLQALQISLAFQMAIALQGHQGGKAVSDADFERAWQLITGGNKTSFWGKFTSLEADRQSLEAAREVLATEEIRNQAHINTTRGKRFKAEDIFDSMFDVEAKSRGISKASLARQVLFKNRGFTINYSAGLNPEEFAQELLKAGTGLGGVLPPAPEEAGKE